MLEVGLSGTDLKTVIREEFLKMVIIFEQLKEVKRCFQQNESKCEYFKCECALSYE